MRYFSLLLLLLTAACSQDPNVLKVRYLQNGDKYFNKGKFREASILYRTALRKDARYAEAYLRLARAELRLGQLSQANPALQRAVELLPEGPQRVEARTRLGDLYVAYLDNARFERTVAEETQRLANELILLDSKSYAGLRIRGEVAVLDAADVAKKFPSIAKTRLQDAISDFRAAEALRPFEPEVLMWLSKSLWASGQPLEAEKYLRGAVDFHKQRLAADPARHYQVIADAYAGLYRLYSGAHQNAAAETVLRQAIESTAGRPEQDVFLTDLAGLLQRLGRRDEMAKVLENLKAHASSFHSAYDIAGGLYLDGGDFRQAIREYDSGAAAFPKENAHYRHLIVAALLAGNQRSEAEAINDSILKDNPKDTDARARHAGFLAERGETDRSIAELEALLRQTPNNALIHYSLGTTLLTRDRREAARVQFAQAIRSDPKYIPPKIALAELELATGEYGNAVLLSESILALDGRNARAILIRAIGLRSMDKREEARKTFELLLALYPKYSEGLFQFGVLNAQENKLKEAEALYQRSFESNPENAQGLRAIVQALLAKNQADQALKLVKTEMEKYPNRPDLAVTLADTEMRTGHLDQAISGYEVLLKTFEKKPKELGDIHVRIAECHKRRGELPIAIAHLEQARRLLPDNPPVLHNLGVIHDMLGKKEQAKGFYEASLKLNGEDPTVLNNLAFYMAENGGNLDQALTYAQRARQKMPHELAFSDTVGVIYLKKNLVDNALDLLQDIVEKQPGEATFHLHLAEALLKKGETAKGRQELRTALASKPTIEDAATIRQLLAKVGA